MVRAEHVGASVAVEVGHPQRNRRSSFQRERVLAGCGSTDLVGGPAIPGKEWCCYYPGLFATIGV